MATLFTYLKQTQRFLREDRQDLVNPTFLVEYINRARREVAARTQCVRRLTPISGSVTSATVLLGGQNYSNAAIVAITPPDFPSGQLPYPSGLQATAQAIVRNGVITAVDIINGGSGYFQPIVSVIDPQGTGTGASVIATLSPINVLAINQEVYPFSAINVSMFPGVDSVYMIKSVNVIYANYRYSLPMYSFTVYQATDHANIRSNTHMFRPSRRSMGKVLTVLFLLIHGHPNSINGSLIVFVYHRIWALTAMSM